MIQQVRVVLERTAELDYGITKIRDEKCAVELISRYMNDHCSMDRENVVILCLDIKYNITAIHTLATGTNNKVDINQLEVFKLCILSNSAGFIIAHNHPTGDATPSKGDIDMTLRLKTSCEVMGFQLIDHIIVGVDSSISMRKNNIF